MALIGKKKFKWTKNTFVLAFFLLVTAFFFMGAARAEGATPAKNFRDSGLLAAIGSFFQTNAGLFLSMLILLAAIGIFVLGQSLLLPGKEVGKDKAEEKDVTLKSFLIKCGIAVGLLCAIHFAVWFFTGTSLLSVMADIPIMPDGLKFLQAPIMIMTCFFILYSLDYIFMYSIAAASAGGSVAVSLGSLWIIGLVFLPLGLAVIIVLVVIPFAIGFAFSVVTSFFNFLNALETLIFKKPIQFKLSMLLKAFIPIIALIIPLLFSTGFIGYTANGGSSDNAGLELPISITNRTYASSGYMYYIITEDGTLKEQEWHNQAGYRKGYFDIKTVDKNVRSIESIGRTVFYIKTDHSLWGYGSNEKGILGDGTGVDRTAPVKIMDDVAKLYVDGAVYAIKTDKTLWAWGTGYGSAPELIKENVINISGPRRYIQKSTGVIFPLANEKNSTLPVYGFVGGFVDKGAYGYYIDEGNTLWLRARDGIFNLKKKQEVAQDVETIWGDEDNLFFIKPDGTLWGIGANENGELGSGTKITQETPIKIADDVVSAYKYIFMTKDGVLWTWSKDKPTPEKAVSNVAEVIYGIGYSDLAYTQILLRDGTWIRDYQNWMMHENYRKEPHVIKGVKVPDTIIFD